MEDKRWVEEMTDIDKPLTDYLIETAEGPHQAQVDHGLRSGSVEVIFRNHRERLIAEIERHPVVLGCVAWFTDLQILKALESRRAVSLVVQKEDLWRPDMTEGKRQFTARNVADAYRRLRCDLERSAMFGIGSDLSTASDPTLDPVRCVGSHNSEARSVFPRMHNKFLVFCDVATEVHHHYDFEKIVPVSAWTGSFNLTYSARRSWENAVLISDPAIAEAYAREHAQVFAFSEPLDWVRPWIAPSYRIGS